MKSILKVIKKSVNKKGELHLSKKHTARLIRWLELSATQNEKQIKLVSEVLEMVTMLHGNGGKKNE